MWKATSELYQRRTLLNRLAARCKFYTAKMKISEKTFFYISRVRQFAADLKSIEVQVSDQEVAMKVLCGLPTKDIFVSHR